MKSKLAPLAPELPFHLSPQVVFRLGLLGLLALGMSHLARGQATVDETVFNSGGSGIIYYVDQNNSAASDNNAGTSSTAPLKTIGAAIGKANGITSSRPAKIEVSPGTYREYLGIQGGGYLYEIEGTQSGKVFVNGSQATGWGLSAWTPVAGTTGVYKKAWPYNYGLNAPQGIEQNGGHVDQIGCFRREAVYVNGARLNWYELENITFDQYDSNGNTDPHYNYLGYNDPSTMPVGSFAINDQEPAGTHPDTQTAFLRLPAGVDPNTAFIEVSNDALSPNDKKILVTVNRSNNFVMRNIDVVHSACYWTDSAVGLGADDFGTGNFHTNMVFDHCHFDWNNGIGFYLTNTQYISITNSRANHNGQAGIDPWFDDSLLMQDNETSYDAAIQGIGWVEAGSKGMLTNSTIRRETVDYNKYIGFWLDFGYLGDNGNNVFDSCDFSQNSNQGLMIEIASGPNLVENSRFINNPMESSYGTRLTTVNQCTFIDGGLHVPAQASGSNTNIQGKNSDANGVCTLTNSTIISDNGGELISFYDLGFMTGLTGVNANGPPRWIASNNSYWSTVVDVFQPWWWSPSPVPLSSAQHDPNNNPAPPWETETNQDLNSTWLSQEPNLTPLIAADPARPATPSGLTASATSKAVTLSWTPLVQPPTSYNVYRVTSYGDLSTTPLAPVTSGSSYVDNSVTAGTTYYYRVSAVNSIGETGQSDMAVVTPAPAVLTAVSRQVHGSAGPFDLSLALTGTPTTEPREGSTAGSYTIVVNFSNNLTAANVAVQLQAGQTGSAVYNPAGTTATVSNSTLTVGLTGVGDEQRLDLHVTGIQPGNGTADVPINILWGKVNGTGAVNVGDALTVRANATHTLTQSNFIYDINASGAVDLGDALLTRTLAGTSLP